MASSKQAGFQLGDHRFLHPSANGPLSRLEAPKRQIIGAPPPAILDGIARESTKKSAAAKELSKGTCCGHGEPTMTIFDIVIDGAEDIEISWIPDQGIEEGLNPLVFVARTPGGAWVTLFRRQWEEAAATLEGITRKPLSTSEIKKIDDDSAKARVAVGFEYPCDATSRDTVTWMTIDVLLAGDRKPRTVVSAELA